MGKFMYQKYDPNTGKAISTNVPPNHDGSDLNLYVMPTGLKDKNGQDIFDLDIIEYSKDDGDIGLNDRAVVISNLKVIDKKGTKKSISVAIHDGSVQLLDDNNSRDYTVVGDKSQNHI